MGKAGFGQKVHVVNAKMAASKAAEGSKSKKDKLENIVLSGWHASYDDLLAALAQAGGLQDAAVLYTDEKVLARCVVALSKLIYAALPADEPRFPEQAHMITRLLFTLVLDEAHELLKHRGAAEAVWAPLLNDGAIGIRGAAPKKLLPGVQLVVALCNPRDDLAADVRAAGQSGLGLGLGLGLGFRV